MQTSFSTHKATSALRKNEFISNVQKTSRSALSDIKHEPEAECFGSDKAHTASILNGLKNETFYTRIPYVSLAISVF